MPQECGRPRRRVAPGPFAFLAVLLFCVGSAASASIQYPVQPNWQGSPLGRYGTGCALRDLDGDGLPDLIVANGNDMARQPLVVYRNLGGTFPATPTWTSADVDYHGHLDLADVDGDGNLDCAVGVYIGAGGFATPGRVKLYHGNGDGTFSANPVWTSAADFYCFSVSFGDVNMDGRPDLACTAGESYNHVRENYRVFRNVGGALETTPYWQSAGVHAALDVTWGDVNGDGILDLAYAGASSGTGYPVDKNEIYLGTGTTLQTTSAWQSLDGRDYANTLCLGDLNGDGWLDLAVADNNQTPGGIGNGRFKLFLNNGAGTLGTTPVWTSTFDGYGSHVSFGDADADGDLDLAAGSWWGTVKIYENQAGVLPSAPTWQSTTNSVVENVVWEDVNNDGLQPNLSAAFTGDGTRRLFTLPRRPVRLQAVEVNGLPLGPTEFTASSEQGWLTIGSAPASGVPVTIRYTASTALDLAVSNWDSSIGEYLFLNSSVPSQAPSLAAAGEPSALRVAPNPARVGNLVRFADPAAAARHVLVFSADGRLVQALPRAGGAPGAGFTWDGRDAAGRPAAAGVYLVRTDDGEGSRTARIVLVP
jgi:hypothetical protein